MPDPALAGSQNRAFCPSPAPSLLQFNYGLAFPNRTDDGFVVAVGDTLLQLQEDGTLEQLRQLYVTYPQDLCSMSSGTSSFRITFAQARASRRRAVRRMGAVPAAERRMAMPGARASSRPSFPA